MVVSKSLPAGLAEGTPVRVELGLSGRVIDEDEGPDAPEEIEAWLRWYHSLEPILMTPDEDAAWAADRKTQAEFDNSAESFQRTDIWLGEYAMKHVKLDVQEESVKRFVMVLAADAGGSILELNGQVVACVVPAPKPVRRKSASLQWTERKNARRSELIDREIEGALTPDEAVELHQLQEMLRYQNKVAPWPIQTARKLHQQLLEKAAKAQDGPDA
jgi:hypothetical protein